jgi:quinol monooxygenase YgiN
MNTARKTVTNSLVALAFASALSLIAGCAPADQSEAGDGAQAVTQSAPLVVVAIAKVKPGTEEDFKKAAVDLVAGTRREPGNLGYLLHQAKDDPTQFAFYERWVSADASDAHMHGPVLGTFFDHVKDEFEPGFPQITQYVEIPVGSAPTAK